MNSITTRQKVLLVFFLVVIFSYSFNQIANSDTFYDITTGQYILHSMSVPTHDIFSLPAYGAEWIPHEWLAQVIFYLVYAASGFWGLISFSALLGVLTYFILWKLAFRKKIDFNLSIIVLFVLSYLTLELWVPRPQIFSYLSFALLIYFLESWRDNPAVKYLVGSVLSIWFWANINASFVLGLVVILFYLLSEFIGSRWREWSGKNLAKSDIKNLGIAAAAAILLAVFATPAGYRGLLYSFYVQQVANYLSVLEWKPITVFLYEIQAQLFVIMIFLTDAFLAWRFLFKKESRDMTLFGLAFGVSLLPFISIRHVGFWPIALFIPAAVALAGIFKNSRLKFSGRIFTVFMFAVAAVFIAARIFSMPAKAVNENIIPVKAADFIRGNGLKGPLFNLYNEGGYLIYRLWPDDKVFIDGRSEVYRGQPILDFFTIFGLHPGWENLVNDKYKINYFLLDSYSNPTIKKYVEPLTLALLKNGFKLVYWDDLTIILARDTPENKPIIDKYGVNYVNPFIAPSDIPLSENKAAAREIQSLLGRFPQSTAIQSYAARFLGTYSGDKNVPFLSPTN